MTSTETLTSNNHLGLGTTSPLVTKYEPLQAPLEEQEEPPMPVRPMSSRPARSSRRASFAEDQHPVSPIKSRPKTSHVSGGGRRRWGGSPPPQPKVEESPEEELLSNRGGPDSPTLRPMTNIYRQPGQQFTYEDSQQDNLVDQPRTQSRSGHRNMTSENDHQSYQQTGYSPTRRYSEVEIQPKIGHYYSRSPSPPHPMQQRRPMTSRSASRQQQGDPRSPSPPLISRQRPMTSRSASRNAMTQVDDDFAARQPLSPTKSGRNSPANRGYIEISGRESRAASRADMRQSWTTPNLSSEQQDMPSRKQPSYSRHYEHNGYHNQQHRNAKYNQYDLNGRRIKHNNNEQLMNEGGAHLEPEYGMRHSTSLSLLPLSREAQNLSFRDKYNRPGSDWNLTTTKRSFRFSEEGFKNARAQPFRPVPSLKIAVEGKRYLSPEKKEVFVRFANRPTRSARPDGRPSPPVSNPLFGHAPQHVEYDYDLQQQPGTISPEAGYGRAETGYRKEPVFRHPEMNRRRESLSAMPDTRFLHGTTTKSTFREPPFEAAMSEKWRPKPVIPATSLKVEGEVTRKTSSTTEHYPAKPYSRQAPTPRQANLSLSKEDISMSTETTYRKNSATVLGSPLKRALRYDPVFRKHDNIDWM